MSVEDSKHAIHVVVASDENYIMPLTVTLCSAAANCDQKRDLVFSIFEQNISPSLRERVERSIAHVRSSNVVVNWCEAPLQRFKDFRVTHHWITPLTFVRLVVPELMPSDVDKAIYLDCDVVVNDDLGELWDTELGEKSLLAARDLIGWVSDPNAGISNFRELGIPGDAKYFNAGVLVLNLAKWRIHGTTERLCKYLKDYQAVIRAADQEALNAVLFHEWGELNFRWNWQVIARYYRIGTHKMGWSPPITKKSIIHFHSSEKPWLPGCDYEERKLFFEYLDRTEWAGWRVPLLKECYERSVRPLSDLRNAFGRFRRKHKLRI